MKSKNISKRQKITWFVIVFLILIIKIFSLNRSSVESLYSTGAYIYISRLFRIVFGWIPFSIGDILYFLTGCWILYKIIKNIILAFQKHYTSKIFSRQIVKLLFLACIIYIAFNLLWGLNYNRRGISDQMKFTSIDYDTTDLINLQSLMLEKVNHSKEVIMKNKLHYPVKSELFLRAKKCYSESEKKLPFLSYKYQSVKSSFYGWWGNYIGFTGYYNPFTGEAQVNTTVPLFLQPDIAAHEMGHQLGYAKEDAASFAGYLASVNSTDTVFHYSTYLNLYMYANREVYSFDSVKSKASLELLLPQIKADIKEWRDFNLAHQGYLEPAITWLYSKYLKINDQPKGMRSYNEVVALVIAYYKKYGII
jgi:hypothetical protein